jgi:hypothetical protein
MSGERIPNSNTHTSGNMSQHPSLESAQHAPPKPSSPRSGNARQPRRSNPSPQRDVIDLTVDSPSPPKRSRNQPSRTSELLDTARDGRQNTQRMSLQPSSMMAPPISEGPYAGPVLQLSRRQSAGFDDAYEPFADEFPRNNTPTGPLNAGLNGFQQARSGVSNAPSFRPPPSIVLTKATISPVTDYPVPHPPSTTGGQGGLIRDMAFPAQSENLTCANGGEEREGCCIEGATASDYIHKRAE